MKIYIGTDHAGFELKEELKKFLKDLGCEVEDKGAYEFNREDDYPDFILPVVKAVAEDIARDLDSRGIVIGGSGQGEAIVANKVKKIRAAVVYDEYSARMSREHNDANIVSLGTRTLSADKAKKLVKLWLETPFSNEETGTHGTQGRPRNCVGTDGCALPGIAYRVPGRRRACLRHARTTVPRGEDHRQGALCRAFFCRRGRERRLRRQGNGRQAL